MFSYLSYGHIYLYIYECIVEHLPLTLLTTEIFADNRSYQGSVQKPFPSGGHALLTLRTHGMWRSSFSAFIPHIYIPSPDAGEIGRLPAVSACSPFFEAFRNENLLTINPASVHRNA